MTDQASLKSAPDDHGIVGTDEEGRITEFNSTAERMLGFDRDAVLGRPFHEVVVPARMRRRSIDGMAAYLTGGQPALIGRTVTVPVLTADGDERECALTLIDTGPQGTRFMALLTPASQSSAELLERAGNAADLGHFSVDYANDSVEMSDALWATHGLPAPARAMKFEEYVEGHVHPDDGAKLRAKSAERVDQTPVLKMLCWRIVRPDGGVRAIEGGGDATYRDDGTLLRVVGVTRDVTDTEGTRRALLAHRAVEAALGAWDGPRGGFVGVLRALTEAMEWRCGALWVRAERDTLQCRAFWMRAEERPSPVEQTVRETVPTIGSGVPGRAWATEDVATSVGEGDAAPEGGAALAFPVYDGRQVIAVIELRPYAGLFAPSELRLAFRELGRGRLAEFCVRHRADLGLSPITDRERQVLQLAADGGAIHAIADSLGISTSTVKTHFEHVYAKLGVSDRGGAVAEGFRQGLIR